MIEKKSSMAQTPLTEGDILCFLKERKEEFKRLYHIQNIGLFGSYSRGDYSAGSDIDLVYQLSEGEILGYFEFEELSETLTRQFNKKIELVNYKYMNPIIKEKADKEIRYV